jgi:DNA-binding NtrC family response regulator
MEKRVLVVDLVPEMRAQLKWALGSDAHVTTARSFTDGRTRLVSRSWDLLVTNLRLGAYNGLHLVYLGAMAHPLMRSIVYSSLDDATAAGEIRAAGAFFERSDRIARALPAYLQAILPEEDRRDLVRVDRRQRRRGGRRSTGVRRLPLASMKHRR